MFKILAQSYDINSLAQTALGIEKYFLDYQKYPESLTDLIPKYFSDLPQDFAGETVSYTLDPANGRYRVWTMGLDRINREQQRLDAGQPLAPHQPKAFNAKENLPRYDLELSRQRS
jgi:hypothetical protein